MSEAGGLRDAGSSALAVTWWGLVMMALALAVVAGGGALAATYGNARAAADAAALAGAGAHPLAGGDGDVCAAAERLAARNGAELADCHVTGRRAQRLRVTVAVVVEPDLGLLRAHLGGVTAEAAAGLAPVQPHVVERPASPPTLPDGGPDPSGSPAVTVTGATSPR